MRLDAAAWNEVAGPATFEVLETRGRDGTDARYDRAVAPGRFDRHGPLASVRPVVAGGWDGP